MSDVLKLPDHAALPRIGLLEQVFRIHHADEIGSGFTAELNGRQYFVTAAHVVKGLEESNILELTHRDGYVPCKVLEIRRPVADLDIAILRLDRKLYSWPDAKYNMGGLYLGCECGFLGFPFGMSADGLPDSEGWPTPFLKKGWLAGSKSVSNTGRHFFLDGHNNKGFSGGPVFFVNANTGATHVFGVVSGFQREAGERGDIGTRTEIMVNAGIVECHSIMTALDALE
jgi:hypothetical protein